MSDTHDALSTLDVETHDIERVQTSAVAVLNRSETEAQLDAAHKYPRSTKRFLQEALTLATLNREVAESCIYTLPRGGKPITGPSIRLAEICSSAYGNLHVASRIVDVEEKTVTAQGIAWDLQTNLRVAIEVDRRITNKKGQRFDDDMVTVTGNAAAAIARRNAIFSVVPRAYVDLIYAKVREVAVGNAATLATRRTEVVTRLGKMGVPIERVFSKLGRLAIEDVTVEDVEVMIGLGTAVKSGDRSIDDAFPPVGVAPSAGTTADLEARLRAAPPKPEHPKSEPRQAAAKPAKPEAAKTEPPKIAEADSPPPDDVKTVGREPGEEG